MTKVNRIAVVDRLGLSRGEAAELIGLSPTTFDRLVEAGKMPPPTRVFGRCVWNRVAVERAFAQLCGLQNVTATDTYPTAPSKWANPKA
jgi:hypothetical protein